MNHNYYTIEDETTKLGKFYGLDKSLNYAQMMTAETKLESATQESGSDDEWLKNYKSPLMQMLENLIKLQKELAKKALERQRESAKKVDIKA